MIFLGTILGADPLSIPLTPTDKTHNTKVVLTNGVFDSLYITKDVTIPMNTTRPTDWTFDTIMFADFNNTTMAGNLLVTIDAITHLVIKRRRTDQFKWITLETKEILHDEGMTFEEKVAQMEIHNTDRTAAIGFTYEYAAVPMLNGIESVYSTAQAKNETPGIVILDDTEIWMTTLVEDNFSTTAVVPNAVIETMWDKYPTIVRNTNANYETITVTGTFMKGLEDCEVDWEDEVGNMEYNRAAYNFLRNGRPKILKATDGRMWLVYVTTPPTDAWDANTEMRKITFGCTEIGDPTLEEDLYDAGLITATEEWWN